MLFIDLHYVCVCVCVCVCVHVCVCVNACRMLEEGLREQSEVQALQDTPSELTFAM